MKRIAMLGLAILAGCSGSEDSSFFSCANGPELVVVTSKDSAILKFGNGREEMVSRVDPDKELFQNARIFWDATVFRAARLNEGTNSWQCDRIGA